jgi:hypothetical protein
MAIWPYRRDARPFVVGQRQADRARQPCQNSSDAGYALPHAQALAAQRLGAGRPRPGPNMLMNCGTHHRQYLVRNVSHFVRRGDVIGRRCQNLLLGVAMRFELTPRNEIITVKDFRHSEYPLDKQTIRIAGWVFREMLELENGQVNGTSGDLPPVFVQS